MPGAPPAVVAFLPCARDPQGKLQRSLSFSLLRVKPLDKRKGLRLGVLSRRALPALSGFIREKECPNPIPL